MCWRVRACAWVLAVSGARPPPTRSAVRRDVLLATSLMPTCVLPAPVFRDGTPVTAFLTLVAVPFTLRPEQLGSSLRETVGCLVSFGPRVCADVVNLHIPAGPICTQVAVRSA